MAEPADVSDVQISQTTRLFVYKLIPPRPRFSTDASAEEQAIMQRHIVYWSGLMNDGFVLAFGPVADPGGEWGMALVQANRADDVRALGGSDPAVTSGMATFEVAPLPTAMWPGSVARDLRVAPAAAG